MATDAAQGNIPKYKGGFTNEAQPKDFVKVSPLKIVPGIPAEQLDSMGMSPASSKQSKKK